MKRRIAVLGAGSFGTALSLRLAANGHDVFLCDPRDNSAHARQLIADNENALHLPGHPFPPNLAIATDLPRSLRAADLCFIAVPSPYVRALARRVSPLLPCGAITVLASKGLEEGTLLTMDRVLREEYPRGLRDGIVALGGPSFATEVARGLHTAVVCASPSRAAAAAAAAALHCSLFKAFTSSDITGVEVGAALKNIVAIAVGAVDGAGLGANARAALITRGLGEITAVAVAEGANPLTLMGLAGLGDLVLTCTGDLSRNRRVGVGLGQGRALVDVLREVGQVAEGVAAARSGLALARRHGLRVPIMESTHAMLHEGKSAAEVIHDIMGLPPRGELE